MSHQGNPMANSEEDVGTQLAELKLCNRHLEADRQDVQTRLDAVRNTSKDQEKQLSDKDYKYSVVFMLLVFSAVYIVCSGVYIVRTTENELVFNLLFWSGVYAVICGVLLHRVCALIF